MPDLPVLRAAFGRREVAGPAPFRLELVPVSPISRAFAPMVRDGAFDVCEMALGTALQALELGKPLVLLPVVLAARFQEGALLCRAGSTLDGPAALRGRRVGVRAYSQTTGLWLRGVLAEDHGLQAADMGWVTFEGAHVAECADPPWVQRAPAGTDMLGMLRDGSLDAAIVGNDLPDDPALRPVFPDPAVAAAEFRRKHGFMPVNHMAVMRAPLADAHPDWAVALVRLLDGGTRAGVQPAINLAQRWMVQQGLLTRPLTPGQVWAGLPKEVP